MVTFDKALMTCEFQSWHHREHLRWCMAFKDGLQLTLVEMGLAGDGRPT